jgi:MFS family permease
VLLIAALAWANILQLWHLFILAVIFGAAGAFFGPAYQAIPPQLVDKEALSSANALTVISGQLGGLLGPLIGAGLVGLTGPVGAFASDGLSFVVSVLSLFAIRALSETPILCESEQQGEAQQRSLLADLREGFSYILGSTWLLWTVLVPAFVNLGYTGALAVALPKLVHDVYGEGAWLLGAIGTAEGFGWIAGAFLVGQINLRRRGIVAFLGNVVAGLALLGFGLPLPHAIAPLIALLAAFVVGVGLSVLQTTWVTLLHELVPNEKLGRVASVDSLGSLALLPIGFVLAGWLTDRFGPASVFLIGGGIIAILDTIPLFLRGIREIQ